MGGRSLIYEYHRSPRGFCFIIAGRLISCIQNIDGVKKYGREFNLKKKSQSRHSREEKYAGLIPDLLR
jgi:hypothetical protein